MPEPLGLEELVAGLRELGLAAGVDLLVHSSLRSLGRVEGGAGTVCEALVRAVSPGGTVCVPTLTGRRELTAANPPRFTPDDRCWTGAIPEAMRHRTEALRSLHPTHSVACVGPRAAELVRDHELSPTPCGEGTPYLRLARSGGRILFIGCTLESNTTFHGIEEELGLGYVCYEDTVDAVVLTPGGEKTITTRIHAHGPGPARCFSAAGPLLEEAGCLRRGTIGAAECILIESGAMVEIVSRRLREDPEFLLADSERGKGWPTASIASGG